MAEQALKVGVVTISDRASQGVYEDRGGPAIIEWLDRAMATPWQAITRLVPDEQVLIEVALRELCDAVGCSLVVTTGGTGPAKRDVTPEATAAVCDKILDGFGERMRAISLNVVPTAILSRQIAGIRGRSLLINLPGKPSAIADCLAAVFPAVPYCIDLIEGPYIETREEFTKAFRPKHALMKRGQAAE
ncbi:MAG: molybdopterin adenylyltransferase [Pseudomonadota bacterium]